jgi:hypothetical protein
MAVVIKPPAPLAWAPSQKTVFLAGSIAMGAAPPWQAEIARAPSPHDLAILDPRRNEWDSTWRQDIGEPRFREQVEWELEAQERADLIAMYFAPSTQAPVTLLELGLFARKTGGLVVCCRVSLDRAPARPVEHRRRSCAPARARGSEHREREERDEERGVVPRRELAPDHRVGGYEEEEQDDAGREGGTAAALRDERHDEARGEGRDGAFHEAREEHR